MAQRSRKRRRRATAAAAPAAGRPGRTPKGAAADPTTPEPAKPDNPAKPTQSAKPAKSAKPATSATPATSAKPTQRRGGWPAEPELSRSERRNAEVRAGLTPIMPGERPGTIVVGAIVAALLGLSNLGAYVANVPIEGKHPAAGGVIVFGALMLVCAAGMWRLWYGAVLGFMALLAIIVTVFALLLIEASNVLGAVVAVAVIGGAGYLFFKLVRVLSRIQMPQRPGR